MDSRLEKLQQVLDAAVAGMSDEEFSRHREGKWCAAEILEHLYLTYTGTIKGFERVLEAGKPLAANSTLRDRLRSFVVFGFDYFPSGREAPKQAVPRGLHTERVRADIQPKIAEMDQIIADCESRFGRIPVLDHPILGPLTASRWRQFHLIHGRHHARQIERLRDWMKAGG